MNALLTLTVLCLISVGQVFSQQPSAGATSLVGVVTGGATNENPAPTRWIEFMDMDNHWSRLGSCFTIEAWVWHSLQGEADWQPVLSRHPGMNAPREEAHFSLAVVNNNAIEVHVGCGCDDEGADCGNGYYLVGELLPETWTHVAVAIDGDGESDGTSGTASLYLNGNPEPVDSTSWGATDSQCMSRMGEWASYGDVKVGYYDDAAQNAANEANPNMVLGWWGRIDEIRFWQGLRTASQVEEYYDVGLKGSESGLFAYYQFSPSMAVLDDDEMAKQITNEVGDYLHGLPQPDPTDGQVFQQPTPEEGYRIDSYTKVLGQSDQDEDLPPISNQVQFESWPPEGVTSFSVMEDRSVALDLLLEPVQGEPVAHIYGNPEDLTSVTVIVTCVGNDCSSYEENWKDYWFMYQASYDDPTPPARMYLQIVTACPSGIYDECGTCEGDNSLCQCVVYHGFESERMSYILFEWSLNSLIEEVSATIATLESTLNVLDMSDATEATLRQQISDLMSFYNMDLTEYCGDLSTFMAELESAIPRAPEALINSGANSEVDGSLPYIPSFIPNF